MIEFDDIGEEACVSIDGAERERFSRTRFAVYGEGGFLFGERVWYYKDRGFLGAFFGCEVCFEAENFPDGIGNGGEGKVSRIVGIQGSREPLFFAENCFAFFIEESE